MFEKNIAEEDYHDNKSDKHNPTSGYVEIEQRTNNNKIQYGMQKNAKCAKK